MREIKFRAFHKPEKKMYDVHGLEWSVDSLVFRERRKALLGEDQPCRRHTMYLIGKDGVIGVARGHEVIVNDYELMQFIGRKDKHGREIYEDDILGLDETEDHSRALVGFDHGAFKVKLFRILHSPLYDAHWEGWAVIGNRYEHPELMEGYVS